ncbi:MAG: AbrB/MazE/SpoVT family DNA-binding domain-containing protein [Thermoplasmata archaeon]|nr:MAG: AbrB/MazE/SpoVT family DNA-binding domain-containing protein [Thermoplasmata archaeon]MCD6573130.1 AbrB/MazE/SpoVT family DNA-binding domain-containing protein [Thermoplasmata archaeon]
MAELEFYGSATVGERGQIALPASLRRELDINAGDKILIFGKKEWKKWGFMAAKVEVLEKLLQEIEKEIRKLMEGAKNNNKNP